MATPAHVPVLLVPLLAFDRAGRRRGLGARQRGSQAEQQRCGAARSAQERGSGRRRRCDPTAILARLRGFHFDLQLK